MATVASKVPKAGQGSFPDFSLRSVAVEEGLQAWPEGTGQLKGLQILDCSGSRQEQSQDLNLSAPRLWFGEELRFIAHRVGDRNALSTAFRRKIA